MIVQTLQQFAPQLKPNQRLLGLDVGEKTIGMALSDALRGFATPAHTIERTTFTRDFEQIRKLITEEKVGGIVIGYPINMNGSEGPRCQSIRQFARNVEAKAPLPILLWDERMSTMAVMRTIEEADLSRKQRDKSVDKMAAAFILQGVLDYLSKAGA